METRIRGVARVFQGELGDFLVFVKCCMFWCDMSALMGSKGDAKLFLPNIYKDKIRYKNKKRKKLKEEGPIALLSYAIANTIGTVLSTYLRVK